MSGHETKGGVAPKGLQVSKLQPNGVQYKYDVPMSVINEANETHDPLDLDGERGETYAEFDSVRGRISEIMFERFLDDHYDEWERYEGFAHDYVLYTSDGDEVTVEVKQRDSLRLRWEDNAPAPEEADLPVRMRDAELYSDVYVMVMFWGCEEVEMVGWTTREVVRTAEWAGYWFEDGERVEPLPTDFERAAELIEAEETEAGNWFGWTERPSKEVPQDVLMDFPEDATGFLL